MPLRLKCFTKNRVSSCIQRLNRLFDELSSLFLSPTLCFLRHVYSKQTTCFFFFLPVKNKIVYRRECLILLQKTIRGHLVRRRHRPRYQGIAKINALQHNLKDMESVTSQLKKEKDSAQRNIDNLRNSIKNACATIKVRIHHHHHLPALIPYYMGRRNISSCSTLLYSSSWHHTVLFLTWCSFIHPHSYPSL